MIVSLAIWLENTQFFKFLRWADYQWYVYPIVLALHLTFISCSAAMVLVTDLRLLGWGMSSHSISDVVNQLRKPKRIGFLLVATCGFLLFGMKAEEYYYNRFFRAKLILLALVFIHAMIFRSRVYNQVNELDDLKRPPTRAKLAALLSLVLWLCIAIAGRGIGYIIPTFHHSAPPAAPSSAAWPRSGVMASSSGHGIGRLLRNLDLVWSKNSN